ncbi:MAG: TlpA family protein disulfide reductase, partial [Bacteroidia bacterium]
MRPFCFIFLFSIILFSGTLASQNCFANCSERLNKSVDTLTAEQMRARLKEPDPLSTNFKILNELHGCDFPQSVLKTLDGKSLTIKEFKGKPVVITFWFTSCSPCISQIPVINKLIKEYGAAVGFISVNTDDVETLKEFLKGTEYNAQQVVIARERAYEEFCTIGGFPGTLVLDK